MINMTKRMTMLILLTIHLFAIPIFADEAPFSLDKSDLVAEAAILINEDTGQVIFEKNANIPMFPASTTKILTALIILEDCDLNAEVTIDEKVPYVDGSSIALETGEVLTVDQLLHAMLMVSANDAAEALAKFHSGTVEAFTMVMNERAASLGALNSNFENPHGLPNENHVSTAYDLAMIAKAAMEIPYFREIIMTPRYTIPANQVKTEDRVLNHSNKFIPGVPGSSDKINVRGETVTKGYDLMTGIKSGYTTIARHCFVGAIEKDGRRYISAILKSEGVNMYIDTRNLLDYGLYSVSSYMLYEENEVVTSLSLNDARQTTIYLHPDHALSVDLGYEVSANSLIKEVTTTDHPVLPISKGEILGEIKYYLGDKVLCEANLIADDDYSGEDLMSAEIEHYDHIPFYKDKMFYLSTGIKLLLALIIWRTIVTWIRLISLRRKRRLQRRKY
ncbi:D-alanyl-D-alanine carboxypeptidase [Fusibacter paucivorans]|uniref:serine-type D-Ala-D-Ala carboxypeptidase n=1 Tax=Fusibacter paucivorans TaxID=76009 RepID=A0ABS5PNR2_9FIRM|nr:D-alanyl-D-alanine carboxypeptidase family protein [Fusibacter paucivorans]MBS7526814.1 D-alanyl-D-alanine carboxypeptidase [Fusibacter paucivorans]